MTRAWYCAGPDLPICPKPLLLHMLVIPPNGPTGIRSRGEAQELDSGQVLAPSLHAQLVLPCDGGKS